VRGGRRSSRELATGPPDDSCEASFEQALMS
jgi:hypothetical protein